MWHTEHSRERKEEKDLEREARGSGETAQQAPVDIKHPSQPSHQTFHQPGNLVFAWDIHFVFICVPMETS
jgi:hypothetical protein